MSSQIRRVIIRDGIAYGSGPRLVQSPEQERQAKAMRTLAVMLRLSLVELEGLSTTTHTEHVLSKVRELIQLIQK